MKLFDHFNWLAPRYERFIKPAPPAELMQRLSLSANTRLLDLGGGTGRVAQFLTAPERLVVVADETFAMLLQARQKAGVCAVHAAAEALPFASAAFERVLMVDALHHVADQQQTAAEMARVTRPGGHILVEEPNLWHPIVWLIALVEKLVLMRTRMLLPRAIAALFSPCCTAQVDTHAATAWISSTRL
jgi:demethylmenaquinone methyltransferase/2-methoxy-6-polyprenyl-1,4-benzoquinol methylase